MRVGNRGPTLIIGGLIMLVIASIVTVCSNTPATPTVEEAIDLGYTPEIEACGNRTWFPELYEAVPYIDLGDGLCEFYYPPSAYTAPED